MATFQIDDMTCGHCVSTISKTVQALDAAAELGFDLPSHRMIVNSASVAPAAFAAAIADAGFTPVLLDAAMPAAAAKSGGCCGRCGGH